MSSTRLDTDAGVIFMQIPPRSHLRKDRQVDQPIEVRISAGRWKLTTAKRGRTK